MQVIVEFFNKIIFWMNDKGEEISNFILTPFYSLPGFIKLIVTCVLIFLTAIGLIGVAKKALKTVVGVACAFIVLLILWLVIS